MEMYERGRADGVYWVRGPWVNTRGAVVKELSSLLSVGFVSSLSIVKVVCLIHASFRRLFIVSTVHSLSTRQLFRLRIIIIKMRFSAFALLSLVSVAFAGNCGPQNGNAKCAANECCKSTIPSHLRILANNASQAPSTAGAEPHPPTATQRTACTPSPAPPHPASPPQPR